MRIRNYMKSDDWSFSFLYSTYFYRCATVNIPIPEFHFQKITVPNVWQDMSDRTLIQATRGILFTFVLQYQH